MQFWTPDGRLVHLIGDPHLGKKFEVGVPLHRRGERERKQFTHFLDELNVQADVIIIVGDLFDHPYVGYAVVEAAAGAIKSAAERNSDTLYVVLAGNHDLPLDITKVGAFHDLDDRLSDRLENLQVVRRPTVLHQLALIPWEWDRRADDQIEDIAHEQAVAAIGHWDLSLFDGRDDHLAPVEALQAAFGDIPIYSGHYHVGGDYRIKGILVRCTGSLEPYGHDQDPDGHLYVTMTRGEALSHPPDDFKDKALRVILAPGEDLPEIDCLALTHIRSAPSEERRQITLSLRDFDWNKILAERIEPLDPIVQAFIEERLPYDKSAQQRGSGDQAL